MSCFGGGKTKRTASGEFGSQPSSPTAEPNEKDEKKREVIAAGVTDFVPDQITLQTTAREFAAIVEQTIARAKEMNAPRPAPPRPAIGGCTRWKRAPVLPATAARLGTAILVQAPLCGLGSKLPEPCWLKPHAAEAVTLSPKYHPTGQSDWPKCGVYALLAGVCSVRCPAYTPLCTAIHPHCPSLPARTPTYPTAGLEHSHVEIKYGAPQYGDGGGNADGALCW